MPRSGCRLFAATTCPYDCQLSTGRLVARVSMAVGRRSRSRVVLGWKRRAVATACGGTFLWKTGLV
eukprot:CAMPEP_0182593280 /NCGR_PEP_ID=MMETSP1324-20130603/77707_1 /TAXON_ID=236786 /ORGANISM="Florenciella sp., Strain RCC1587" /LENGTH=65 /DNA_ID=CAMNT_0024810729 /DNA_START=21 /DNA_END=216 /DNA_ORIENTATION=+